MRGQLNIVRLLARASEIFPKFSELVKDFDPRSVYLRHAVISVAPEGG